ncbi:MAG: serine/threonine-protein kinase [Planctomycetota bacterium]
MSDVGPGLALSDSQFENETNLYLQRRLRWFYGATFVLALAIWLVDIGEWLLEGGKFGETGRLVHGLALVVVGAGFARLGGRPLPRPALRAIDATGLWLSIGAGLTIYATEYEMGLSQLPALVLLFVIARAVLVPSSPLATLVISAPLPILVLAVQSSYGVIYIDEGVQGEFMDEILWRQMLLWFGVGIAVFASQATFGLRRQVEKLRTLGQYHLEEQIGRGSMGEVYRATHALLKRPAAVKLLSPEIAGRDTIARFDREVQQTARLTHPNTIRVFDYGFTGDGYYYYAMEYLEGTDLEALVEQHGALPPARVIHVLAEACRSLQEAHDLGLVHRDIKPSNILLCRLGGEHDIVKVVDFGLVRDIGAVESDQSFGHICGTPETMAPEIIDGADATPRADLYALGCVGYYLLTGTRVFDADTAMAVIAKHLTEDPIPPSERRTGVPADLEQIVLRCLAKDASARFADAATLRSALLACNAGPGWSEQNADDWWRDHVKTSTTP